MHACIAEFVSKRWSVPAEAVTLRVEPLRGGLESVVARATMSADPPHPGLPRRVVVKELRGGAQRESDIYGLLWRHLERPPAARLLGVDRRGDTQWLYLEDIRGRAAWPWADRRLAAAVCRELARLHDAPRPSSPVLEWDYEADLRQSAEATLGTALRATDPAGTRYWRRLGDLKRVVAALTRIRAALLEADAAIIHGDVHPGNVMLRGGLTDSQVALIDWGRARIGSPLEDVASWLHSLGCWEPQARKYHDTLWREYLEARSVRRRLTADLRQRYWYASASNGLAGAIRYHLAVLADPASTPNSRRDSGQATRAWARVIRRASALLNTSRADRR